MILQLKHRDISVTTSFHQLFKEIKLDEDIFSWKSIARQSIVYLNI